VIMCRKGVACMAGRSLGARLGLLTNLLVLTRLSLSWDNPDLRTPAVPDEGEPTDLYCPRGDPPCGAELMQRVDKRNWLFCPHHGPIGEREALTSPPAPGS
jgi:hypothetical protein